MYKMHADNSSGILKTATIKNQCNRLALKIYQRKNRQYELLCIIPPLRKYKVTFMPLWKKKLYTGHNRYQITQYERIQEKNGKKISVTTNLPTKRKKKSEKHITVSNSTRTLINRQRQATLEKIKQEQFTKNWKDWKKKEPSFIKKLVRLILRKR